MFDVDDIADNVVLSGITYLLMLVDTKRSVCGVITNQKCTHLHAVCCTLHKGAWRHMCKH